MSLFGPYVKGMPGLSDTVVHCRYKVGLQWEVTEAVVSFMYLHRYHRYHLVKKLLEDCQVVRASRRSSLKKKWAYESKETGKAVMIRMRNQKRTKP